MKDPEINPYNNRPGDVVVFQQFIDHLVNGIMPLAYSRKNSIVNEVQPESFIKADQDKLAFIVSNLLTDAVNSTTNSMIHISAFTGERIVLLQIKLKSNDYRHSYSSMLSKIQEPAKKMGGNISIETSELEGTLITFTFCNMKIAA